MLEQQYGMDRLFWCDEHWTGYDPLSIPEATERANWYGLSEYPYVRVDGSRVHIGIQSCEHSYQSLQTLVEERLAETGGISPVQIMGRFVSGPSEIWIEAAFRLVDPVQLTDLRATLVLVEDSVRAVNEVFPRVARKIAYQQIVLSQPGDSAIVRTSIIPDPSWIIAHTYALVFLQQNGGNKQIIQGALLRGDVAGVDRGQPDSSTPLSRIESAVPNPFRESTLVAFSLTPVAAQGDVRLEIFDPSGRHVGGTIESPVRPGPNVWSWNGRDDAGRPVEAGVYFARLRTVDGVSMRKLIRIQ
jgi:hypothetical protein